MGQVNLQVELFTSTLYGLRDGVTNVPMTPSNLPFSPTYVKTDYYTRHPYLISEIVLNIEYNKSIELIDYMKITNQEGETWFYFVTGVTAGNKICVFRVVPDVISTYNLLEEYIGGTIIREHNVNPSETYANNPLMVPDNVIFEVQNIEYVSIEGASNDNSHYSVIESPINLDDPIEITKIAYPDSETGDIEIPSLKTSIPGTMFSITDLTAYEYTDVSSAFSLWDADTVPAGSLNTVRGANGQGLISDSYKIPKGVVSRMSKEGSKITSIQGGLIEYTTNVSVFTFNGYDNNLNVEGSEGQSLLATTEPSLAAMNRIEIRSIATGHSVVYPVWDLIHSVTNRSSQDAKLIVNLWADLKPTGAPFCGPKRLVSTQVNRNAPSIGASLSYSVMTSVRGGTWLREAQMFQGMEGETFASIQSNLDRRSNDFQHFSDMRQIDMAERMRRLHYEADTQANQFAITQATNREALDVAALAVRTTGQSMMPAYFGPGPATAAIAAAGQIVGGAEQEKNRLALANAQLAKAEEYNTAFTHNDRAFANMVRSRNAAAIDVEETARRAYPPTFDFVPRESLASYNRGNGFMIITYTPNFSAIREMLYRIHAFGSPVHYNDTGYGNTRQLFPTDIGNRLNHRFIQVSSVEHNVPGIIGDLFTMVLQNGLRAWRVAPSADKLIYNPKSMS